MGRRAVVGLAALDRHEKVTGNHACYGFVTVGPTDDE